jgi:hypothetical protein
MEAIDTLTVISRCWDHVRELDAQGADVERVQAILAAVGEGYPFPTNLDRRPPAPGGMAPESEVDVLQRALLEDWDTGAVVSAIQKIREDSRP